MTANLTLKWGTVKGWDGFEEGTKARELMDKYLESGVPFSAAMRQDTPKQKQIICEIIEAVDGEIYNDWEGRVMTKDEAKQYVITYRQVSESDDH